jgi:precorrin-6B methylase 2
MARTIEPAVQDVLTRSVVEGNLLKLPEQLERAEYVKVDKVLKGLGGRWDRKAGGHVFPFPAAELVGSAAESGTYRDRKRDGQMFFTPHALVCRMVELADVDAGQLVLEPSAGTGNIVTRLLKRSCQVVAVEPDDHNANELAKAAIKLIEPPARCQIIRNTFELALADPRLAVEFDAVVMNPPFAGSLDAKHVQLAWGKLRRGGRLVAIVSEGLFQRQTSVEASFRKWTGLVGAEVMPLPRDTFKEEGTQVGTALIRAVKGRIGE